MFVKCTIDWFNEESVWSFLWSDYVYLLNKDFTFENLGFNILQAFEEYSVEKDIAENIKKEFDKKHGATWHCIVGRNFG